MRTRLQRFSSLALSLILTFSFVFSLMPKTVLAADCPASIANAFGECSCPSGVSDMDCEALLGPWPNWDPNSNNFIACGTGDAELIGSDNIQKIYNYFTQTRGMKPWMAAGFLGNIWEESGHTFDPTIVQGGGHSTTMKIDGVTGYGIIQWTSIDRQRALQKFADSTGRPVSDLGLQLDFIWEELNQSPYKTNTLAPLLASTNVVDATHIIELHYEIHAAPPIHPIRTQKAQEYLASLGSGSTDASGVPQIAGNSTCTSGSVGGAVNGFIFPLVTSQSSIKNNKPYAWCYQSQTNCHHDYNAADIFTPEGTQVIAAYPGTVVMTENISGKNADVAIMGDDKNVYFYQHMAPGSLQVAKGTKVTAGTPLGKVGNKAAAFGTDTHLHFDMLPPPNTSRMGCAGAGCSSYPFINVQPRLIQAYQALKP